MAKVDKQQQVQELLKRAEDGTRAVFESENYRNYLVTMSKFHNYSFRNNILIYMQKPESTYVAGYVAWQKNFNRQVQRGEKGIQIVGYSPKNIEQQQEKKDANGNRVLGADGKPETETVTIKIPVFFPVYVYDVSQTEGEPLPQLVNELDGSVEAYQDLMTALRDVSPFPIVFEDIEGGAKGYSDSRAQKIAVQQGMSEAQTVKTTIHEITHADLHAPEINIPIAERTDRQTREVQAESVAFIVCNHYGIDSSDYSFAYLAEWSSNKELNELQNSLETIQKQASELITRIDNRLAELSKEHIVAETSIEVTTVAREETERYFFSERNMLPINAEQAIEYLNNRTPVHLLASDNTATTANVANDIQTHIANGGLLGVERADYNNAKAEVLAVRYDQLVQKLNLPTTPYPFNIEDVALRANKIQDYMTENALLHYDTIIENGIQYAGDTDKDALIREYAQLQNDIDAFRIEKAKQMLSDNDGEPVVVVNWSENPTLINGSVIPLHSADRIFRELDAKYPQDMGYEKTSFSLIYEKNGVVDIYNGRQDFGDKEGGIIDHIRNFWEWELSPDSTSRYLADGNTGAIDEAKEALYGLVPYLTSHAALGQLREEKLANLRGLETYARDGVSLEDIENIIAYNQDTGGYGNMLHVACQPSPFPPLGGRWAARQAAIFSIHSFTRASRPCVVGA